MIIKDKGKVILGGIRQTVVNTSTMSPVLLSTELIKGKEFYAVSLTATASIYLSPSSSGILDDGIRIIAGLVDTQKTKLLRNPSDITWWVRTSSTAGGSMMLTMLE